MFKTNVPHNGILTLNSTLIMNTCNVNISRKFIFLTK